MALLRPKPDMNADPDIPSDDRDPQVSSEQVIGPPPKLKDPSSPPPLPPFETTTDRSGHPVKRSRALAIALSLCLGLFLADGIISALDDSLIVFFGRHTLAVLRGLVSFLTVLVTMLIYGLMGMIPAIPKRVFLPVTLFNPIGVLLMLSFCIYLYDQMPRVSLAISLCQVIVGLIALYWCRGELKFNWPLFPETRLKLRRFSWGYVAGFLLANLFVLLPLVLVYLFFCASLAVGHFSEGFMALRPGGLSVQVRKYFRDDGKTIQLFPMSHVGDAEFYRRVSQSFPTNSTILMEGVTDDKNLLTNRITYRRMATSLGLKEQQEEFRPSQGEMVPADVDVEVFAASTIDLLNVVMLVHSKGVNAEVIMKLLQYSPPPHFEEQLSNDLLRKRNRHLLSEIQSWLSQSDNIVVPWGVAHMPEIAKEIEKSGFRVIEARDYEAIRFRMFGEKHKRDQ